ncbi:MAG: anthranilate phosphoribosyltransferase [Candidatus Omnitrophota bacterium]
MMRQYIEKLEKNENLSQRQIEQIMQLMMSGQAAKEDVAAFLLALNQKGPTVEEITGAAKIMREFCLRVKTRHEVVLDTCGTGGDQKNTFNISTVVALVVAAVGVVVAKHGNRSVSSQCGSADVLEALGVKIDLGEEALGQCLDEVGIAFLFAQKLHPAMKNVASVRKELGVKTLFNILGPLTNPAQATHQIVGVYNRDLVEPMAQVLKNLELKKALVVCGSDGLDEITTAGKTFISEFDGEKVFSYDVEPQDLGLPPASEEDFKGGDLGANVRIVQSILEGKKGPQRDIVLMNAGYALYTAGRVKDISKGVQLAAEAIDTGKAYKKLQELKEFTERHA